jgi:hypothetical protein
MSEIHSKKSLLLCINFCLHSHKLAAGHVTCKRCSFVSVLIFPGNVQQNVPEEGMHCSKTSLLENQSSQSPCGNIPTELSEPLEPAGSPSKLAFREMVNSDPVTSGSPFSCEMRENVISHENASLDPNIDPVQSSPAQSSPEQNDPAHCDPVLVENVQGDPDTGMGRTEEPSVAQFENVDSGPLSIIEEYQSGDNVHGDQSRGNLYDSLPCENLRNHSETSLGSESLSSPSQGIPESVLSTLNKGLGENVHNDPTSGQGETGDRYLNSEQGDRAYNNSNTEKSDTTIHGDPTTEQDENICNGPDIEVSVSVQNNPLCELASSEQSIKNLEPACGVLHSTDRYVLV